MDLFDYKNYRPDLASVATISRVNTTASHARPVAIHKFLPQHHSDAAAFLHTSKLPSHEQLYGLLSHLFIPVRSISLLRVRFFLDKHNWYLPNIDRQQDCFRI